MLEALNLPLGPSGYTQETDAAIRKIETEGGEVSGCKEAGDTESRKDIVERQRESESRIQVDKSHRDESSIRESTSTRT